MKKVLLTLPIVLVAAVAGAQELSVLRLEVERLARGTPDERDDLIAELRDNYWKAVYLTPGQAQVADLLAFRRADVQTGAGAGASGSTSALAGPLLPAIFGVGLENGALTRTVSGTTVTLKAMPAQLLCASRPGMAIRVVRREADACRTIWRRVGVTASFDTSRGEKKEELDRFEALRSQFAELAVRVEIVNRRTASGAGYLQAFEQEFDEWHKAATAFASLDRRTDEVRSGEEELSSRLVIYVASAEWEAGSVEDRVRGIEAILADVAGRTGVPGSSAQPIRDAWLASLRADARLQNAVANAPVLTAEYTLQQPDLAVEAMGTTAPAGSTPPRLNTGRVIYAQGWADTGLDLTVNASASWFDDVRPGMPGRFRDARTGVEAKFKLRELANYGTPTLSFAFLYTYLRQEPLGLGLVAFDEAEITERGHIRLFQTKLEFPTAGNTIRIPLSFTYSNRTELVKESEVRGQLGITFNLDALFAERR